MPLGVDFSLSTWVLTSGGGPCRILDLQQSGLAAGPNGLLFAIYTFGSNYLIDIGVGGSAGAHSSN